MVSKFLVKVGESAGLAHVPGSPEQTLGNQFVSRCKCGQFCKSGSTPTTAYQHAQDHADRKNAEESPEALRSALGDSSGPPEPYRSSRPEKPRRAPSEKPSPRPCTCECGGQTGGGLFLPGHDAKLLSKLAAAVRDRTMTVPDAMAKLAAMPKLHDKMASRLRNT